MQLPRSLDRNVLPQLRPARGQQMRLPMPTAGLNLMANTMTMTSDDCYVLENLIAKTQGLEIRKGWQYWTPLANKFVDQSVKTIISFVAQSTADSRLFCGVTDNKVYDITTQNNAPVLSLTPTTNAINAGEWYFTNYVTAYITTLCMCAAGAGYYIYTKAGGWQEITIGSGSDGKTVTFPSGDIGTTKDFAFCWVWKNRLWFIAQKTAKCYYLPIGQTAGALSAFDFGPQLTAGGPLSYACNWTYDSGQGIDDSLVLVSENGNVLVYQGTDPANATSFSLKGVWTVGRTPVGRRGFAQYGGDVLMVTEYGVVRLSDLISGKLHTTDIAGSIAQKINPFLAQAVTSTISQPYWFIIPYPTEELVYIGTPYIDTSSGIPQDWAMNSLNGSWGVMTGIDPLCAANYYGQMVCGRQEPKLNADGSIGYDGTIIVAFTGYLDGGFSGGSSIGKNIQGKLLGAFLDYGDPSANKRMLRVKLYGIADGTPIWIAKFIDEYDMDQQLNVYGLAPAGGSTWDVAIWDKATWGAGRATFRGWYGTSCFGKKIALQLAISGTGHTLVTDYEAVFESGMGL